MDAPGLDEDGRFAPRAEPLDTQSLVAELAVATFRLLKNWCELVVHQHCEPG